MSDALMILFRTDGNDQIGIGHVMRCLSLASAFSFYGQESCFAVSDSSCASLISKAGYRVEVLRCNWMHPEEDEKNLNKLLECLKPDMCILDSYNVSSRYLANLRAKIYLVYLDDLLKEPYPVDVVINYNVYATQEKYKTLYAGVRHSPCKLLGPRYVPLRKEFCEAPTKKEGSIKKIIISSGGANPSRVLDDILRVISEIGFVQDMEFHVVVGPKACGSKIGGQLANPLKIKTHINPDMRYLMLEADAAIAASGSTMYELFACGVPVLAYAFADNQLLGLSSFKNLDLALLCSDIRSDPAEFKSAFEKAFKKLLTDKDHVRRMTERARQLVDGRGAYRIVEALMKKRD